MRRERLYLHAMVEAADDVASFIADTDKAAFMANDMLQRATKMQLIWIGGAAEKVPPEMRTRYPEIDWADLANYGTSLLERYWDVDNEQVWERASRQIPAVRELTAAIISAEFPEG